MKSALLSLSLCALLSIISCKDATKSSTPATVSNTETVDKDLARKSDSVIEERVVSAKTRLESSAAGKIVWDAMEAHGGLKNYFQNGPLSFRFDYVPKDGSTRRYTDQTIDTWSNKARHWSPEDRTNSFGWDGQDAWKKVKDSTAFPFDMRFWALTPYYFLAQPFILDGEGVHLEKLADKTYKDIVYNAIKVTFAAGTGDAPDDYYVLYFGKEDHKLAVIRYIVSYPQYFPEGGHSPEKLMEIKGTTIVDGIELATGYHTHWLTEDENAGEHITTIKVDNIKFLPKTKNSYFEVPKGAVIIE